MEHFLPCGCCRHGCLCSEHAPDRQPIVCNYHQIENRLVEEMRAVFERDAVEFTETKKRWSET